MGWNPGDMAMCVDSKDSLELENGKTYIVENVGACCREMLQLQGIGPWGDNCQIMSMTGMKPNWYASRFVKISGTDSPEKVDEGQPLEKPVVPEKTT